MFVCVCVCVCVHARALISFLKVIRKFRFPVHFPIPTFHTFWFTFSILL